MRELRHRFSFIRRLGMPLLLSSLVLFSLVVPANSQEKEKFPSTPVTKEWLKSLQWRSIGPANMSGRVTAMSVYEADPTTYYVATASGGLLKTVNNGVSFEHLFDKEDIVSIGDVCVAPSNKDIVWIGTGEGNPRNSVSYGKGVYKSTDGGKTWKHMGLDKTFQIGKVIVHPKNPDIVYVGALGRLYGPNPERGLYKTIDGGKTWSRVLFVNDKTGVIDMRMHPTDPDTLLVATYERKRDGYDFNDPVVKLGKGSGLYKTTDGGKTFKKITKGLPTCTLGRIGLDWYHKDPNVVVMILESEKIGMAPKGVKGGNAYMGIFGEDAKVGALLTRVVDDGPAAKSGLQVNDIVTKFGGKEIKTYQDMIANLREREGGEKVDVLVKREGKSVKIKLVLGTREDGGNRPFTAYLGGQKENVQNRQGKDGFEYGGIYKSTDGGDSWVRINSLNPRPMYFSEIRIDPSNEKKLYVCGVAFHYSFDGGKTFKNDGGRGVHADLHAVWVNPKNGRHLLVGCDGGVYVTYDSMKNFDHLNHVAMGQFYHVAVDSRPNYRVYGGLQDNGTWGGPSFTKSNGGPVNSDWVRVGGGDGFRCAVDPNDPDLVYFESQNGALQRRNFRTGEFGRIRPPQKKGVSYRFNWNTPFLLSNHNSRIYYCAGNYVFKSLDRGNELEIISPDITKTKKGSATALAESPRNPKVIYVGTDDGALWVTKDGGNTWDDIQKNVGLPGLRWVASIEASRYADGRAYVVFDGHRSDDDEPYVYVTEDFGKTWKSLRSNLPGTWTRVLREDIGNEDLLYLGTELGAWASVDRGESWVSLNTNLPTVAIHEFAIHPTAGEIVAATHGRSLWVLDVTPLRQFKREELAQKPALYEPASVIRWVSDPSRGGTNREFTGQNPKSGVDIYFSLPKKVEKVELKVVDPDGKTLRTLKAPETPGLHKVNWNLTRSVIRQVAQGGGRPGAGGGRPGAGGFLERLKSMDKNDDGKLSRDELPEVMQVQLMRRADTNDDGFIDQAEMKAIAENFGGQGGGGRAGAGGGRGGRGPQLRPVGPGTYRVVLTIDGDEMSRLVRVLPDPSLPLTLNAEEYEQLLEQQEMSEDEENEEIDLLD